MYYNQVIMIKSLCVLKSSFCLHLVMDWSSLPTSSKSFGAERFSFLRDFISSSSWHPLILLGYRFNKVLIFIFGDVNVWLPSLSAFVWFHRLVRSWRKVLLLLWFLWNWVVDFGVLQLLIGKNIVFVVVRSLFFTDNKWLFDVSISLRFESKAAKKSTLCLFVIRLICRWLWEFQFLFAFLDLHGQSDPWRFLMQHVLFEGKVFCDLVLSIWDVFFRSKEVIKIVPWLDFFVNTKHNRLVNIMMPQFHLIPWNTHLRSLFGTHFDGVCDWKRILS